MLRSLALAAGRFLPAALLAFALSAPAPARAQDPSLPKDPTLAEQRAEFKKLHQQMLLQKSRVKLAQGKAHADLVRRAARGDKAAKRELAKGVRARRPYSEEANLPVAGPDRTAEPAAIGATSSIPFNVRANNPAGDNASAGQCEEAIGVLGDNILVAWNDGQGFVTGGDTQGYAWSSNGGLTFTDGGDVPHPPAYPNWEWTSDPVVTVNEKTGEFWYCGLANPDASNNAIGVARGRFAAGVFTFDSVFVVRIASNASFFLDKQWMAADSLSGNLYVTNTTFTLSGDQIDVYRSTNGGRTWSAGVMLSSAGDNGYVQGSRPAIGPNGEVYVVWYAIGQVDDNDYMKIRKSTDFGVSYTPEVIASPFISNFTTGAPAFNRERGLSFPSIAVDRTTGTNRGRVYVSWNESWDWLNDNFTTTTFRIETDTPTNNATNSTTGTANLFTVGQTIRGTLQTTASTTDNDYFSVVLNAGDKFLAWADSFTAGRAFTLRMFAPNPDGAQRLCYTAKADSNSSQTSAVFVYTAPVTGTYFVRMAAISRRTMNYRIRTAYGVRATERGRDQRDAFTTYSDNGTAWSTPAMMNTDAVGYDNWLPEVGVGGDGLPYGIWFDHRDDTYGSRAHMYMSRSTNGGVTWGVNQRFTSAQSNFTTAPVNIAPNQGDYSHIAASTTRIHPTWSDGRAANPSVDVFTAAVLTTSALSVCQGDTTVDAGAAVSAGWTFENHNPLFDGAYGVSISNARGWPISAPSSVNIPAESSVFYPVGFAVPDSAAAGANTVCVTLTTPGGVVVGECCFDVTVTGGQLGVGDHLSGLALAPAWPNPSHGRARIAFSLPNAGRVKLSVYDLAGARVRTLVDGERASGAQSVEWDGRDSGGTPVRAGAYFVRLEFAGRSLSQRMVMTR